MFFGNSADIKTIIGGSFYQQDVSQSIKCQNVINDPLSFRVDDTQTFTNCAFVRTCGIKDYAIYQDNAGTLATSPTGLTYSDLALTNAARIAVSNTVPKLFDIYVKATT